MFYIYPASLFTFLINHHSTFYSIPTKCEQIKEDDLDLLQRREETKTVAYKSMYPFDVILQLPRTKTQHLAGKSNQNSGRY